MRNFITAIAVTLLVSNVESFQTPVVSSFRTSHTAIFGYVPEGFTAESYKKLKDEEANAMAKKKFGVLGPMGFKSRSLQSFQEAMERNGQQHLWPVFNAKERVAKGEIHQEDIPYMQRGGAWDNSDVKGAKTKQWLASDKEYADGGYRTRQSVSIFGFGSGLDWTGARNRDRPPEYAPGAAPKFSSNYQAPNVNQMNGAKANGTKQSASKLAESNVPMPKKFFGLF